jgi:hypothetical protein
MQLTDISFSVHDYDFEGDIFDSGIFLHFGDTRIKIADNLEEFKAVAHRINDMGEEIAENYANKGV